MWAATHAGAVVLSVGATGGREAEAGLAGDLSSLLASAVMVGYLSVGRRLRQWMPIFIYAFPVTGSAALALTLGAVAGTRAVAEVDRCRVTTMTHLDDVARS